LSSLGDKHPADLWLKEKFKVSPSSDGSAERFVALKDLTSLRNEFILSRDEFNLSERCRQDPTLRLRDGKVYVSVRRVVKEMGFFNPNTLEALSASVLRPEAFIQGFADSGLSFMLESDIKVLKDTLKASFSEPSFSAKPFPNKQTIHQLAQTLELPAQELARAVAAWVLFTRKEKIPVTVTTPIGPQTCQSLLHTILAENFLAPANWVKVDRNALPELARSWTQEFLGTNGKPVLMLHPKANAALVKLGFLPVAAAPIINPLTAQ
jgi:hypothetical protein